MSEVHTIGLDLAKSVFQALWPEHLCVGQCGAADSDTRFEGALAVSFGLV